MQTNASETLGTARKRAKPKSIAEISRELEALQAKSSRELAATYEQLFGVPTRSNNRDYLLRQIAWRLQDHAGHFEVIRKRVDLLAPSVEVPVRWRQKAAKAAGLALVEVPQSEEPEQTPVRPERDPRLPPPGTILRREYEGLVHEVVVLEDGFEHAGKRYPRLTQVAHAITGRKWNGFEFLKVALADAARAEAAS